MNEIKEQTQSRGMRWTRARQTVLYALMEFDEKPFTAEDLHRVALKVGDEKCDLVSIYRNLKVFEELGLVQAVSIVNGRQLYEFTNHGQAHHHYIICQSCQKVDPVSVCIGNSFATALSKLGYSRVAHQLAFTGICKHCTG